MRLFQVITENSGISTTAMVLCSDFGGDPDVVRAEQLAVAANGGTVLSVQAVSESVDLDARSTGLGSPLVCYITAQDYTQRKSVGHWVAAKYLSTPAAWDTFAFYSTFGVPMVIVEFGGDFYVLIASFSFGDQPDISPSVWSLDSDAPARLAAMIAVNDLESTPPLWDSSTSYAQGTRVWYDDGFGYARWEALVDNFNQHPSGFGMGNPWTQLSSVQGTTQFVAQTASIGSASIEE